MLNINHHKNANQILNEIPLHTHYGSYYQKKEREREKTSVNKDVEKLGPLCIAGRIVK